MVNNPSQNPSLADDRVVFQQSSLIDNGRFLINEPDFRFISEGFSSFVEKPSVKR